ncbi:tyrosine-type recombinase/integrase [Novosphingobium kaempferiae]|uniref:tyrosine-type recombinase/integrase n=1 Tax=Novosphingobium kaempferiae TaxID=2896849 RepID=UPI001E2BCDE3|nr:integrase arm-type DNA-binding domain-containing protein [Novosphingobium kaempferiae]
MLTTIQINALKAREKPYKVADAKGLYILVNPNGSLLWRVKFRFHGIEKKMALGRYPDVGLKEARQKRDEAREQLEGGVDPLAARIQAKIKAEAAARTTFRVVTDEFIEKMEREGKAPATLKKMRWFRDELQPTIGHRPIAEISAHELLNALKRFERKEHFESAIRARSFSGRVFRYAVATLRAQHNPADILRGALITPKVKHHAALLEPAKVGELLRAIDGYGGKIETRIALQLAPHVYLRPGELRKAEWGEIDFDAAVWRVPAERTKMRKPHAVPLSTQVVTLLRELRAMGNLGSYLFPANSTFLKPICENTLNVALRRLGFTRDEMTSHGFRSIASTLLNESGLWHPDAIERSLAHRERDSVRAAYHRGAHWEERVRMAQWWSDYLCKLRDGAEIIRPKFGT